MTDKEEAIERLKKDKNKPLACGDITIVDIDDLEIVLNLLEKKDVTIIETKEANRQLSVELQKKDKIIDLVAETLRYYNGMKQEQCFCIDICGEKECDMKNCKDRIKQYYERKVENG